MAGAAVNRLGFSSVALRDEGKIGAIGLSNVSTDQVRHALDGTQIACVQNAYNLLTRGDEPTLALCAKRGLAYVPFFPLGSAFGWLPRVTDDAIVQDVAAQTGSTPVQVGLAWLLAHDPAVLLSPAPGTSSTSRRIWAPRRWSSRRSR